MIPKGNPANIRTLNDLGNDKVRISMPNPQWEGIGEQIKASYKKAGANNLSRKSWMIRSRWQHLSDQDPS
jgi:ABC-type sulfate transport system substrate-binding protein